MEEQDLAAQAVYVRGLVADWNASGGYGEKRLRILIQKVEDIGKALLNRGAADPELKAEILAWVVRFRAETAELPPVASPALRQKPPNPPTASKSPVKPIQSKIRRPYSGPIRSVPRTRTFDYDTTDSRTAVPGFVKKARAVPAIRKSSPVPPAPPSPLGTSRSAVLFTKKLIQLREDVRRVSRRPRGSADSLLKARILEMHQTRTTSLAPEHHEAVGLELEELATLLGGTVSSYRAGPGTPGYVPVPEELSFSKGGPVVSGGLPTLGRGHR